MKTKGFIAAALLMILGSAVVYGTGEKVRVHSTKATNGIAMKWAGEYNRSAGAGKVEVLMDIQGKQQLPGGDLFIVSGQDDFGFGESWKMVVAHEVIVPVISSGNTDLSNILHHGISPAMMADLLKGGNDINWGTILNNQSNRAAVICTVNDERIYSALKDFTKSEVNRNALKIADDPAALLEEMRKDPSIIGICRLSDILGEDGQTILESIALLPVDRDGNGVIDHNEDIYSDYNTFTRAVWIGKYPHALVNNVYSVASAQPLNEDVRAFLSWIIYDGQKSLGSDNLTALTSLEVQSAAAKLVPVPVPAGDAMGGFVFRTLLIAAVLLLLTGFAVDLAVRRLSKPAQAVNGNPVNTVFDESAIELPGGIYFDKTHTWAYLEHDGSVRVGIDDFMHHVIGPVTRIRMKSPGEKVKKGDEILSVIRNGKQLNLYSPVSGIIRQKNSILDSDISKLNNSPYTEGWVYTVEPENWHRENLLLFTAARQREYIKAEISKLRDFLAKAMTGDSLHTSVVLQDGGALLDHPLSDLSPEVWEEFQTKFIDPARQIWFYELF